MPAPDLPQYHVQGLDYPMAYTATGAGPAVLLVHGSLCDYRYWRWQLPALGARYRVLAPSLRGYWPAAYTRADPRFNVEQHARDLADFIRLQPGASPVHLLGHSRGARVALELACNNPELLRSLTLADPGFPAAGDPAPPAFHYDAVRRLEQGDIEGALAEFVDTVNGPDTWRRMVGWFKTMVRDNAGTLLSQVREAGLPFDMARVQALECPVLLLGGADSPPRYGRRQDTLQAVLRDVERAVIPQAAHGMNLANPLAFNRCVLDFLDRHAQAGPLMGTGDTTPRPLK
ncbi:alpha/beta fold hydrolase [Candidimonas nitroreducens]|uniref:Alpha/beta hydrolase n=1 Tax=Candidimonas nitroreducens TaxID=683354 RepID=A0A225LYK3_9BURK|nr:alpha/beta hydrolase [Candidimonas nitroreducens]OWT54235.1 alpha/beta hydrolase [Candidimonas nitroreducens]